MKTCRILPAFRSTLFLAAFFLFIALTGSAKANSLVIPQSVQEIGNEAYFGCSNIENVILPEGILRIGERAFDRSDIAFIRLPASLQSIADSCFDNTELEKIEAPFGTYAYDWAYEYISKRNGITLISSPVGQTEATVIKKDQYAGKKIDVLVIDSDIETIEEYAFRGATINNLFIHDSLEDIDWRAFAECHIGRLEVTEDSYVYERLESGTGLPGSMESDSLFVYRRNDDNTYSVFWALNTGNAPSFVIPGVALDGTRITAIETGGRVSGAISLTIEEGIEEIKDYNFTNSDNIRELHLPQSLKKLGKRCFEDIGMNYEENIWINLPDNLVFSDFSVFYVYGMSDSRAIFRFKKGSVTEASFRGLNNHQLRFSYYEHPNWIMYFSGGYWTSQGYVTETVPCVAEYTGANTHLYFPRIGKATIGGDFFNDNDILESVYIPEGYIEVPDFSYCDNLKSIILPSTLLRAIDPWYHHEDLKIFVPPECAVIDDLLRYNRDCLFTYTFFPGLSVSVELAANDIKAALTYTKCDLFSVKPWPIGDELSVQEETAIILSFLERVCASDSGRRITLTSIRLPNLCGEEITTHYYNEAGENIGMTYTIDTMLVATGKLKGSLFGLTADATSVIGTTWITYNNTQYVIMPTDPDSIVRSLNTMQTILSVDAAKALQEGLTLNVDALDVLGKNGFIAYMEKIFLEAGIDTTSMETVGLVESAIESKSDEEYYENLKKLIAIAKNLILK